MINVELHVIGGKHAGQVIPLHRKKFLIGREADCQLRPNSELVSRHHCIFSVDDFSVRVRDLGSTNGTLVNGERIRKEVVLHPGDNVVVGCLEFKVIVNELSDVSTAGTISPDSEETVVAGADTLTEMPPIRVPIPEITDDVVPATVADTGAMKIPAEPATAVTPPAEMPQFNVGDTTVISQPMLMPGQTPYQPMMPQQMGYPQMYGNYPYPQMPMYMPQPGYPGGMPGYHQPQAPAPAPAQPEAPTASANSAVTADGMNVSLPDPSETGAKAPAAAPAPPPPGDGEVKSKDVPSNQSAAAIIQQHMKRRPGS